MKKILIGIGVAVILVGCGSTPVEKTPEQPVAPTVEKAAKLEKASNSCERIGGVMKEIMKGDGTSVHMCTMPSTPAE